MVPPAPGRFSTTNGWPSCSARRCVTVRAMMSVALPAVNGTITCTRLVGHDCASAVLETRHPASAATHIQDRLMATPLGHFLSSAPHALIRLWTGRVAPHKRGSLDFPTIGLRPNGLDTIGGQRR